MIIKFLRVLRKLLIALFVLFLILLLLILLDGAAKRIELTQQEASQIRPIKLYPNGIDSLELHYLDKKFGDNKKFPEQYKLQCLLALSHYPELKETKIDFEVRPAFVPLYSWPRPISVFLPWVEREFIVVISTQSAPFLDPILFHKLPFNDQVGIIGHELAHTVFYKNKNSLETLTIAVRYQFNRSFQIELERDADRIAIRHGLGYQLYDYAFFVRKAFGRSLDQILTERGSTYLSPNEIATEMEKYSFYTVPLNPPRSYFD